MLVNEGRNFWTEQKHNDHSNDDCSDHHFNKFCGSAGGDHAVERKNSINQHDLNHCFSKWKEVGITGKRRMILTFQLSMNLFHVFIDQIQSTTKHHDAS